MAMPFVMFAQQYGTCTARNGQSGECISISKCVSNGGTSDPGRCPGANSIQCCTYGSCRNPSGVMGKCQPISTCRGISGPPNLCPGGSNIQCCTTEEGGSVGKDIVDEYLRKCKRSLLNSYVLD